MNFKLQSNLIICRSHIRKFTYSLKFVCNPKVNTCGTFMVSQDTCREVKNRSHLMSSLLAELKRGDTLPSRFSYHIIKRCPFHGLYSATLFSLSLFLFASYWRLPCLKWPSSGILQCWLVLLRIKRL